MGGHPGENTAAGGETEAAATVASTSAGNAPAAGGWRRRLAPVFRWLHIYLSMVSFGILLFFAVTGLTLNHADWFFGDASASRRGDGTLERAWVAAGPAGAVAKLEVVEHLRRAHGLRGLVGEFRIEDEQCAVVFKGPGYAAEASVERATGRYTFSETRMGFVAVINDLHKGRDSGPGWSWVVDLSAVLMTVVSLTGLGLIWFVKRRLVTGLATAAAGVALSWAAYVWLVP